MDSGVERIADSAEEKQVRRQARKVELKATLAAALLTLIAVLLPSSH